MDDRVARQPGYAGAGEALEQALAPFRRAADRRLPWGFLALVVAPTLATAIYMLLIASPVYVSEARFVVRSRAHEAPSAFGTVLQSVGVDLNGGATDAYEVHEFMMSRDAMADLVARHQLREVLARPGADLLARFPRPFESPTVENLYRSYKRFVSVGYDSTTGISTLRVEAFQPDDARNLAGALLDDGERLVNELNRRAAEDAISQAVEQVGEAQGRAIRAESALTAFRSREKLIDPTRESVAGATLVNQLDAQIMNLQAERNSLAALAPQSPELPALDQKIRAFEAQREAERTRVAGESNSLAPKIGEYERLTLERDYAAKSLASANAALEDAQLDARKKQSYLERVVAPDTPDKAEQPQRWFTILMVFVSSLIAYATIMLVLAGLREHRQI
jgi:capsular polysaccharide transport system permease protein